MQDDSQQVGGLTAVSHWKLLEVGGFSEEEVMKMVEIAEGKKPAIFNPIFVVSQQLSIRNSFSDSHSRNRIRDALRSEAYQEANHC